MADTHNSVTRVMSDEGGFRVIALRTTELAQEAIATQGLSGPAASIFAELLTAAVLVRETMAPTLRVQVILKLGNGRFVADSHPDGLTRGLAQLSSTDAELSFGDDALLQVIRTMPEGRMHQSVVHVGAATGVSGAVMSYLQESEQVMATLMVGALVDDGRVVSSGGYLVQLLPELEEGLLMVMTERLETWKNLSPWLKDQDASPSAVVEALLYRMAHTHLATSDLRYACVCSEERVLAALATLPPDDISELLADKDVIPMSCDYCGCEYRIPADRLAIA